MQVIEIRSKQDLGAPATELRKAGAHSYKLHCRLFASELKDWHNHRNHLGPMLPLMTLGADRIWITREESERVAEAIRDARSPVALD